MTHPPIPTEVVLRNTESNAVVDAFVRSQVEALGGVFPRIEHCRVVVDVPHRHHRTGNRFHVRLQVSIPGEDVIVDHEPGADQGRSEGHVEKQSEVGAVHRELDLALRHAFAAARRQLQSRAQRMRGEVKRRS